MVKQAAQLAQVTAEVEAKNAVIESGRIAMMEQLKARNWLAGKNMLDAWIKALEAQGTTSPEQIAQLRQQGATQGLGAAIAKAQGLFGFMQQAQYQQDREDAEEEQTMLNQLALRETKNTNPFAGMSAGGGVGSSSSTNGTLPNLWNTHVTPLLDNLSNQWNGFIDNLTAPANPVGLLFNFPTNPTLQLLTNTINLTALAIDNTVFGGNISQSISNFNQTLKNYPAYNVVVNTFEFAGGAALQYANDMSFGLIDRFVNFENGSGMFQAGMEFGRTVSTLQGAVEFVFGAASAAFFLSSIPPTGAFTAGCAATTMGLCFPFGGIAIATEAALAGAGIGVMAHGAGVLAHNANHPLQIRGDGSGSSSGNYAYDTAKSGGKHSGLYNLYKLKPTNQIKNAFNSYQRVVQEHYDKIANPEQWIDNWGNLPDWRKEKYIEGWREDIARNQELADIMYGILQERGAVP